ncbi:hypothetical protein STEG23_038385, partial [Scotinomys teguina]
MLLLALELSASSCTRIITGESCHGLNNFTSKQIAGLALRMYKFSDVKFKDILELIQYQPLVVLDCLNLSHLAKFETNYLTFEYIIHCDPDLCPDDLNLASTGMYSKSCPDAFLHILLPGSSRKPSLLTLQGPLLAPGEKLTFQCCSDMSYDRFALSKEGGSDLTQMSAHPTQAGESHANFTLHSVNLNTGGRYRCYGSSNFSSEWSAPSDHLDVVITGHPPVTPNLSVHPGTTVSSGEKVTLLCKSSIRVDSFLLFKEGEFRPYMHQVSKLQDSQYQAEFSMRAVTPSLRGSYMCFGSQRSSPYLLSKPSVPVEIIVSDSGTRKIAARENQHEDFTKDLYAQVKPSRLRRAEPTCPSLMPKERFDSKDRQAKEDQAAVSDHRALVTTIPVSPGWGDACALHISFLFCCLMLAVMLQMTMLLLALTQ